MAKCNIQIAITLQFYFDEGKIRDATIPNPQPPNHHHLSAPTITFAFHLTHNDVSEISYLLLFTVSPVSQQDKKIAAKHIFPQIGLSFCI